MSFQDDENWFELNRAYIANQYQGQWVIILGSSVRGAYPTKGDAFNAAVKQFGPYSGFVIKQAIAAEKLQKMGMTWTK